MKRLSLMFCIAIVATTLQTANAQVSLNVNIGTQPNWGPRGYDYVEYYYLPEIHTYYHVPTKRYVYLERNHWVNAKRLPKVHRHYNLYNGRKVIINEPKPYLRHNVREIHYVEKGHGKGHHHGWHKDKGPKGRGRH